MFRQGTVFVMPSTNELQSIATLEAMASGLPVVAANALALPELVEDGKSGFLFQPRDPAALADRIGRLLSDKVRTARMGCAAREVAERHGIDGALHTLEGLYRELLLYRPPRPGHGIFGKRPVEMKAQIQGQSQQPHNPLESPRKS